MYFCFFGSLYHEVKMVSLISQNAWYSFAAALLTCTYKRFTHMWKNKIESKKWRKRKKFRGFNILVLLESQSAWLSLMVWSLYLMSMLFELKRKRNRKITLVLSFSTFLFSRFSYDFHCSRTESNSIKICYSTIVLNWGVWKTEGLLCRDF